MTKSLDMTTGRPLPLLLRFALPTLAGNLLHQVYSITDSVVVGRFLGQTALASTGCTSPIVMLLAALMIGVNVAVGILISHAFGRRDYRGIRRTMINSLYLGLVISAVLALLGGSLAEPILRWMGTPEGPLRNAVAYLRINFITAVCPLFYYLFSSVFRGMGDSRTALYCLVVSALGNVGLDVLFVAVFHWGVPGTAWATALAQAMSAVFAAVLLWCRYPEVRPSFDDCRFDWQLFKRIAGMAVPIAVQSAFNNLSNVVAQSGINTFGETVMAAYTAAGRLGTLTLMPLETIASSLSVFAGQNHGAGTRDRIRQGIRAALLLCLVSSILLGALLLTAGGTLAGLFLSDPSLEIIAVVRRYLLITAVPGILAGVMHVYQQVLRGVNLPGQALAGGIMQLLSKILAVAVGAWVLQDLDLVWLGWPLSFLAGSVVPFLCCRRYLRGSGAGEETP